MNKSIFSKDEILELKLTFQLLEDNGSLNSNKVSSFVSNLKNYDRPNINKSIINIFDEVNKEIQNKKIGFEDFLNICSKYTGKNTPEEDFNKLFLEIANIKGENLDENFLSKEMIIEMLKQHCGENHQFKDEDYNYFYDFYYGGKEKIDHNSLKDIYYK